VQEQATVEREPEALPDREECELTVIWRAEIAAGAVRSWTLTAPE